MSETKASEVCIPIHCSDYTVRKAPQQMKQPPTRMVRLFVVLILIAMSTFFMFFSILQPQTGFDNASMMMKMNDKRDGQVISVTFSIEPKDASSYAGFENKRIFVLVNAGDDVDAFKRKIVGRVPKIEEKIDRMMHGDKALTDEDVQKLTTGDTINVVIKA